MCYFYKYTTSRKYQSICLNKSIILGQQRKLIVTVTQALFSINQVQNTLPKTASNIHFKKGEAFQ